MVAYTLRIAATLGILVCLHNAASANLVIKFYADDGGVWMSLSGSGQVPPGSGNADSPLSFEDFTTGDPFPGIAGALNLNFDNSTLTITQVDSSTITAISLIGAGTDASDVTLAYMPNQNFTPNDPYTFSGAARVTNLTLSQLQIGTYSTTGGDASSLGTVQLVVTPEPASLAMMGVGVLGLCATGLRRRRRRLSPLPCDAPATVA